MSTAQLDLLGARSSAVFSPCRRYRYQLERIWDASRLPLVSCGLNPSIADHDVDDPTIRLEMGLAKRLGYGGLVKVNLFALISTDPRGLKKHQGPVGRDNLFNLRRECATFEQVLCTWGAGARKFPWEVVGPSIEMVCQSAKELLCLGVTKDGDPWHPLRKKL